MTTENGIKLVNRDGTVVGIDPETGDEIPIEFNQTQHESVSAGEAVVGESAGTSGVADKRPLITNESKTVHVPGDYGTIQDAIDNELALFHRHDLTINVDTSQHIPGEHLFIPQTHGGGYRTPGRPNGAVVDIRPDDIFDVDNPDRIVFGGLIVSGVSIGTLVLRHPEMTEPHPLSRDRDDDGEPDNVITVINSRVFRLSDVVFNTTDSDLYSAIEARDSIVKVHGPIDFGSNIFEYAYDIKGAPEIYHVNYNREEMTGSVDHLAAGAGAGFLRFSHGHNIDIQDNGWRDGDVVFDGDEWEFPGKIRHEGVRYRQFDFSNEVPVIDLPDVDKIEMVPHRISTDGEDLTLYAQLSDDGGSTWLDGSNDYNWARQGLFTDGTEISESAEFDEHIEIAANVREWGGEQTTPLSIGISSPRSGNNTGVTWSGMITGSSSTTQTVQGGGSEVTEANVNAIRFFERSEADGSITQLSRFAGTVKLYPGDADVQY